MQEKEAGEGEDASSEMQYEKIIFSKWEQIWGWLPQGDTEQTHNGQKKTAIANRRQRLRRLQWQCPFQDG